MTPPEGKEGKKTGPWGRTGLNLICRGQVNEIRNRLQVKNGSGCIFGVVYAALGTILFCYNFFASW